MIVYKVVEKNTRNCSNWTMFKIQVKHGIYTNLWKKALKFKKDHPEYFPRYFKGRVIKRAPNSIGILCFKYKDDAISFQSRWRELEDSIIIKVKGNKMLKRKPMVVSGAGGDGILHLNNYSGKISSPEGTITFDSVEVLE